MRRAKEFLLAAFCVSFAVFIGIYLTWTNDPVLYDES